MHAVYLDFARRMEADSPMGPQPAVKGDESDAKRPASAMQPAPECAEKPAPRVRRRTYYKHASSAVAHVADAVAHVLCVVPVPASNNDEQSL
jgi:hypothetical protein